MSRPGPAEHVAPAHARPGDCAFLLLPADTQPTRGRPPLSHPGTSLIPALLDGEDDMGSHWRRSPSPPRPPARLRPAERWSVARLTPRPPPARTRSVLAATRAGLVASLAPVWIWSLAIAFGVGALVTSSGWARACALGILCVGGWGLLRARSARRTIRECLGWSGLARRDGDGWQGYGGSCR